MSNKDTSRREELPDYIKMLIHAGFDPLLKLIGQDTAESYEDLVDKIAFAASKKFTAELTAIRDELKECVVPCVPPGNIDVKADCIRAINRIFERHGVKKWVCRKD